MANLKKLALGQKVQDLLAKYQNFALIKIDRTSHQTLESLRKELKKNQANFKVVKNTLFEKTLNKLSKNNKVYEEIKKSFFPLKETSALLLLRKEWNSGLTAFYQFLKKEVSLSFKFGHLDDKSYGHEDLLKIAQLPPRNQLLANLIGNFKTPSSRLVHSMKFNITKLVYILKEKAKKSN
ncbi:50S ribosomal protein L10 [Candidatus Roizmanbacteria bacterium RIFCSPHIGHO2_01_FULL_35_10]|uniref:Large ribosomal subunit protein uL10 n=1 Tax=Candidatus Roizmanbacteria bacterium RIFCSPLOWO2_01_FULL_35_13 TaxID=1802055 RepID=A0A1F7I825_9BACT|nr:MAG: 50S ribosomal protein L10 [Candidatus Roizmanbacteria bacterium RIFCSPHIGHO2_01_FULL_35_10]OGK39422.1 MAG: 50S ribosomal protein L10 [Candidatus Roizmanbacteria bacterium RIFCSPLOWO2_01_FULL_35_13]